MNEKKEKPDYEKSVKIAKYETLKMVESWKDRSMNASASIQNGLTIFIEELIHEAPNKGSVMEMLGLCLVDAFRASVDGKKEWKE